MMLRKRICRSFQGIFPTGPNTGDIIPFKDSEVLFLYANYKQLGLGIVLGEDEKKLLDMANQARLMTEARDLMGTSPLDWGFLVPSPVWKTVVPSGTLDTRWWRNE